ncbi:uncharacterized protein TRIREDRAFT_110058 [Trichoderma reesei QM6a]|uniref:Predicted protein n=2 Tax=Hypocrea jecorina TaxID=51453 RepID=G0RR39_HYPJQ|nr:uncharacterized protein TRIREDRAFT_110058 [Trichoderma reesei QM6a]EGR46368.1 predicted protein [Trichoderma reesei QM6a]ETR99468.1 hypothetical protein M419DRAFT_132396 [Trichoderma reesei RUT C-30]
MARSLSAVLACLLACLLGGLAQCVAHSKGETGHPFQDMHACHTVPLLYDSQAVEARQANSTVSPALLILGHVAPLQGPLHIHALILAFLNKLRL